MKPRSSRPQDKNALGQPPNMYRGADKDFSAILEDIDAYYPQRPVFVFGYSQLVRGISYRSRRRVPSHFILLYKDGMPLCRLIQAAGRAMGEQASALRANGFERVELLTQTKDFDAIRAYPEFLTAIKDRMRSGMSLKAALEKKFSGELNCFHGKNVGQKKLQLQDLVKRTLTFELAEPGQQIGATAEDTAMGTNGRGLTRAILEVMLDGFPSLVQEREEAVTTQNILEILTTNRDYDEYFEAEQLNAGQRGFTLLTRDVTDALKRMESPNANRPPVVLGNGTGKARRFYLNMEGVDRLPGRDRIHRPHHQPAVLNESQMVELMEDILTKSENAVLKLSGVPTNVVGWQEGARKQLAKLVHPNKWASQGQVLVDLATRAFQKVQSAYGQYKERAGQANTFVPDETDHKAVVARREAAASVDDDEEMPAYCGLSAANDEPPSYRSLSGGTSLAPPSISRSASLSKRELHLQRSQQNAQEWKEYEAAQEAAQEVFASVGLTPADDLSDDE